MALKLRDYLRVSLPLKMSSKSIYINNKDKCSMREWTVFSFIELELLQPNKHLPNISLIH